jgi:hypothetical protein
VLATTLAVDLKKQLNQFWQIFNILRKKKSLTFEIVGVSQASVSLLHISNVRHSIAEKGSYY